MVALGQRVLRQIAVDRNGRRFVPPAVRPSTDVSAVMGRERPASGTQRPPRVRQRGRSRPNCQCLAVVANVSRLRVENRSPGGRDPDRSSPAKQHGSKQQRRWSFLASSGQVLVQIEAVFGFDRAVQFPSPTFGAVRRRSSIDTRALERVESRPYVSIFPAISGRRSDCDYAGALGRVKAPLAGARRCRGLDPPSALPMLFATIEATPECDLIRRRTASKRRARSRPLSVKLRMSQAVETHDGCSKHPRRPLATYPAAATRIIPFASGRR